MKNLNKKFLYIVKTWNAKHLKGHYWEDLMNIQPSSFMITRVYFYRVRTQIFSCCECWICKFFGIDSLKPTKNIRLDFVIDTKHSINAFNLHNFAKYTHKWNTVLKEQENDKVSALFVCSFALVQSAWNRYFLILS